MAIAWPMPQATVLRSSRLSSAGKRRILQPYRLKAYTAEVESRAGKKAIKDRAFTWVVTPSRPTSLGSAPAATPPPLRSGWLDHEDRDLILSGVRAETREQMMGLQLQSMQQRLDELEAEPPMGDLPLPWYQGPEGAKLVSETLTPIAHALGELVGVLTQKAGGAGAVQGASMRVVAGASEQERLIAAWSNFAAQHPKEAATFREQLLQYLPQTPSSDADKQAS